MIHSLHIHHKTFNATTRSDAEGKKRGVLHRSVHTEPPVASRYSVTFLALFRGAMLLTTETLSCLGNWLYHGWYWS